MTNEEFKRWWNTERQEQLLAIQKWQPQPPPPEPEMRTRMASASPLDSQLPRSFKAAGNAAASGIGWGIGAAIAAVLVLLGAIPCIGFIVACFMFLPLPAVIIGLLIWGACAASDACTRATIREELKQHELNLKE